ncbi:AAA family ATPase [Konateibacter massiliensis]|uniref:AAA family ATPase n=1 Tax=Konateibacter massiliensis TaxID=2002841 RepID=UPI000C159F15|nr:AAA family ATPase [Konateibacter massiliensis]
MIYLSSFLLSGKKVKNPNIYPYNVFAKKDERLVVFSPITVLYGDNGSGKSTLLNIIANTLEVEGKEHATNNKFGMIQYFMQYVSECRYGLGEDEEGNALRCLPGRSRYIKSEDILYEIKKIEQEAVLEEGYIYEHVRRGMPKEMIEALKKSDKTAEQLGYIKFGQEKYSNGETTMQMLMDYLEPDALYLLDEPEVSLSPANQVRLAEEINKLARLLNCQFIIATHSPFMLGTLNAKIYNLDSEDMPEAKWSELENVRYFYDFFKKHETEFE